MKGLLATGSRRGRVFRAWCLALALAAIAVYFASVAGRSGPAVAGTRGAPVVYTTVGSGGIDRLNLSNPLAGPTNSGANSAGPVAITADGNRAVVGVSSPSRTSAPFVDVINVGTNASAGTVAFTNFANSAAYSVVALAVDPVRPGIVYVLLYSLNPSSPSQFAVSDIEVINVAGTPSLVGQLLAPTTLGSAGPTSTGMAISPDGAHLLVSFSGDGTGGVVSVPVGGGPLVEWDDPGSIGIGDVAIAPNGSRVYLSADFFGPVEAIGYPIVAGEPRAWMTTPTVVSRPLAITVSPDGSSVYVAGQYTGAEGNPAGGGGAVEQFRASDGKDGPSAHIPAMALNGNFQGGASGLAVSPDGSQVLVAGQDGVNNVSYLYDLAAGSLGAISDVTLPSSPGVIGTGIAPQDVAITPDQAPVANLSPASGTAGTPTFLTAASSNVAYGSITSYQWKFGDGHSQTTPAPNVSHTYAAAGNYTVTVTETDSARTSIPPAFGSNTAVNGPGTTPYLNASASARKSAPVTISPPGTPPPPPTTTTLPTSGTTTTTSTPGSPGTTTTTAGTPALILNPGLGPPGTIVTVTGTGFPKNTPVTVSWSISSGSVVIMSDANGNLPPAQLVILVPDVLGPRFAVASSTPQAKAPFLVVPNSAEPGGDSRSYLFRSEGP